MFSGGIWFMRMLTSIMRYGRDPPISAAMVVALPDIAESPTGFRVTLFTSAAVPAMAIRLVSRIKASANVRVRISLPPLMPQSANRSTSI